MKCFQILSCVGKMSLFVYQTLHVEVSNCCIRWDPHCCIILLLVIGSVVLKLLKSQKEIHGVRDLWRCQHHGVRRAWSLSNL